MKINISPSSHHQHPRWSSPQVAIVALTPAAPTPSLHQDTHPSTLISKASTFFLTFILGLHSSWFRLVYLLDIKLGFDKLFSMICGLVVLFRGLIVCWKQEKHSALVGGRWSDWRQDMGSKQKVEGNLIGIKGGRLEQRRGGTWLYFLCSFCEYLW